MDQEQKITNKMNNKRKMFMQALGLILIVFLVIWVFGNNTAGYYHVLQKWPSGELKIIKTPGLYWKGPFSKVTEFQISDIVSFVDKYKEHKKKRVKTEDAIKVIFKDNGAGAINGVVRYSLPDNEEKMKKIVKVVRSEDILKKMIKANINTVLTLIASSYKSGESVRERGRFIRDVFDSLQNGLIAYEKNIVSGDIVMSPVTEDNQIKRLPGLTSKFGIGINNFTLKLIEYDAQTQTKLDEHRLLEQQRDNAVLAAEKLKQETLTAQAEEMKLLAVTKAQEEHKKLEAKIRAEMEKEVAKIKAESDRHIALIQAEKEREVAKIKLSQAALEKKVRIEEAEGEKIASMKEAQGRSALAKADNSLALRLQMRKETLIGVANALKDIKVPHTIIGKSDGNSAGNPVLDIFLMNQIKELQSKEQ